jgi:CMP-N,N'-diacetyllegionaminic acid synthase
MTKQPQIVGVIPARGGSKGIPNKNLQRIGDLTLTEWAIRAALQSDLIPTLIITSDSTDILKVATNYVKNFFPHQFEKVHFHNRSEALATDDSKIADTLKAIVDFYSISESNCQGVLMLQPTSPFRRKGEIDLFLKFAKESDNFLPTVSVKEVTDSHPARMYFKNNQERLVHSNVFKNEEFFSRQELTRLYLRDGSYYLMSLEMIGEGKPVSENSKAFVRGYPFNLNIDEYSDLELSRIEYQKVCDDL